MSKAERSFLKRAVTDQRGQVLPWMALLMVLFLGMGGLTIDLGHAFVVYRELQSSTDAATLAGAYAMTLSGATSTSVDNEVKAYSSLLTGAGTTSGYGANANFNLQSVSLPTPTLSCVTNSIYVSVPCTASATGDNVIQVTQTATIPMYFIQALKVFGNHTPSTLTVSTTSTAAMQSGEVQALNLAVVLDTTASMNNQDNDANCGNTELYCALQGMQTLLQSLSPCSTGSTSSNCLSGYDQVSLFTFPNIQANQASDDTTCTNNNPNIPSYSAPAIPTATNTTWTAPTGTSATYQVTGFEDDYSANNQQNGGIATGSPLGIASGANTGSNCGGLEAPGGDGTYIAGAMYAAMTALQAEQSANPGSKSAIILLSDGGANSSKFGSGFGSGSTYPSKNDQCQQTVAAGQYATQTLGMTVYTVAYGASNNTSDCSTDSSPSITPCAEMLGAASNASDFYSDATAAENKGACTSADNPNLNLKGIFTSIANRFTAARLVPNTV
ncbi:MAG: pilus assembly protein TadG-related protein [Terracidiphilus sp.]|jgi:Flp pilus assembly protein TadG